MARKVARGKALVAQLRARADVRDPEALAAWLGRFKAARKAGKSVAAATAAAKAGKDSNSANGGESKGDTSAPQAERKPESTDAPGSALDEDDPFDDPFNEDWGEDEDAETPEDRERAQYEAKLLREMKRDEIKALSSAILDAGGIQTRADLREEYREIPNHYKRRDGLAGDVMAEYLGVHHPELGIETENDLLDFFLNR